MHSITRKKGIVTTASRVISPRLPREAKEEQNAPVKNTHIIT